MKQKVAAMMSPIFASGMITVRMVRIRPHPRFHAASTRLRSTAARLKSCSTTTSGRGEGEVADHRSERRVEHRDGPEADKGQESVDDPFVAEKDLPGVGAHEVAREEGNDEEEDGPAPRRRRDVECERVRAGEGEHAGDGGGGERHGEGKSRRASQK